LGFILSTKADFNHCWHAGNPGGPKVSLENKDPSHTKDKKTAFLTKNSTYLNLRSQNNQLTGFSRHFYSNLQQCRLSLD